MLDTTVNHMPEVFEYQFRPDVLGHNDAGAYEYVLAGMSCLAGDIFGEYRFDAPLRHRLTRRVLRRRGLHHRQGQHLQRHPPAHGLRVAGRRQFSSKWRWRREALRALPHPHRDGRAYRNARRYRAHDRRTTRHQSDADTLSPSPSPHATPTTTRSAFSKGAESFVPSMFDLHPRHDENASSRSTPCSSCQRASERRSADTPVTRRPSLALCWPPSATRS